MGLALMPATKKDTAMTLMEITLTPVVNNQARFDVRLGRTFLASVSFDGPRGTIRTHEGALRADERKVVYHLYNELVHRVPVDTLCGAPKDV
jgi:hypothetical protein